MSSILSYSLIFKNLKKPLANLSKNYILRIVLKNSFLFLRPHKRNLTYKTALLLFVHGSPYSISLSTQEIQIPLKYGYISGKLWGSSDKRPILALHGWQDNAGTWDALAPMLIKDRSILAIDFPGHGLSSWIPDGMMYCDWEWIKVILYIKQYFKWDKVSLLSHSMGSLAARRYSGLFPDDVDLYIGIDILVYGYLYENLDKVMDMYPTLIQKAAISQTRLKNEPPLYTLNEITKIKYFGSNKSVALKSIPYLLERGIKQSEHNPTKYYFTRDPRTKYILFANERNEFIENLIKRLKCPTLFIKATDSPYENDKSSAELQNKLQKNNEKYESQTVLGTHHVHLNDPEKVAPLILNFLNKYMKR